MEKTEEEYGEEEEQQEEEENTEVEQKWKMISMRKRRSRQEKSGILIRRKSWMKKPDKSPARGCNPAEWRWEVQGCPYRPTECWLTLPFT